MTVHPPGGAGGRAAGKGLVTPADPAQPMIRPVTDADSAALIRLIGAAWAEYPGCVLDVDGEEPWLRAPATAHAAQGGRMWVAEWAGQVVGCVGLRPVAPDTVELKRLYVAAAARRRGLGQRLTGLVEAEARRRGAARVELWSDTRFTDAHRLYQRLGYERLSQTRALHDRSDTTELHFARRLDEPPA